jgi:hypothetical protein
MAADAAAARATAGASATAGSSTPMLCAAEARAQLLRVACDCSHLRDLDTVLAAVGALATGPMLASASWTPRLAMWARAEVLATWVEACQRTVFFPPRWPESRFGVSRPAPLLDELPQQLQSVCECWRGVARGDGTACATAAEHAVRVAQRMMRMITCSMDMSTPRGQLLPRLMMADATVEAGAALVMRCRQGCVACAARCSLPVWRGVPTHTRLHRLTLLVCALCCARVARCCCCCCCCCCSAHCVCGSWPARRPGPAHPACGGAGSSVGHHTQRGDEGRHT